MAKSTTTKISSVAAVEKAEDEQFQQEADAKEIASDPGKDESVTEVRDSGPTAELSSEVTNAAEPTPADMAAAEAAINEALKDMQDDDQDDDVKVNDPDGITDLFEEGPVSKYRASHNEAGHRNMFVNARGDITIVDDEVAAMFYENPSFFSYTWDEGQKNSVHVTTLQWCDRNGVSIGEQVGKPYDLNN